MTDISELNNSELEEMGLPLPCECLETYEDEDDRGRKYRVCNECFNSWPVRKYERYVSC